MASEYSSIRLWAWKCTQVPHYTVVHSLKIYTSWIYAGTLKLCVHPTLHL